MADSAPAPPFPNYDDLLYSLDRSYMRLAKSFGLSCTAADVLYLVSRSAELLTQRDVSDITGQSKQLIASVIRGFQEKGLAQLEVLPGNMKNKAIVLTDEGVSLSNRIAACFERIDRQLVSSIGEQRLRDFLEVLAIYHELMEQEAKRGDGC